MKLLFWYYISYASLEWKVEWGSFVKKYSRCYIAAIFHFISNINHISINVISNALLPSIFSVYFQTKLPSFRLPQGCISRCYRRFSTTCYFITGEGFMFIAVLKVFPSFHSVTYNSIEITTTTCKPVFMLHNRRVQNMQCL